MRIEKKLILYLTKKELDIFSQDGEMRFTPIEAFFKSDKDHISKYEIVIEEENKS